MTPTLFYGVPEGCSLASIVALEWLGAPYALSRIVMMEHPWPADYTRHIHPLNLTPAYVTSEGAVLTQSLAILLHLAARQSHQLGYPEGTPGHDRLTETLAYLNTDFFAAFAPLWTAYEMEADPRRQQVLRDLGRAQAAAACQHVDGLLVTREWMDGGPKKTVADAYLAAVARWAEYHGVLQVEAYPHLHAHLAKLRADPAVAFSHAIERGEPVTGAGGFQGHVALANVVAQLGAG
ncbi:glutathione S-transferase family protein [Acidovorax sp.]|uniref:glutathione S-transferase family protein n=1 Tax=Acidovorax sp. TaxID=1872122 RepID=UPI00391DFA41